LTPRPEAAHGFDWIRIPAVLTIERYAEFHKAVDGERRAGEREQGAAIRLDIRKRGFAPAEHFLHDRIVLEQHCFHEADARAMLHQDLPHVGLIPMKCQHERRPMLIVVVGTIDVRARGYEQVEHVPALPLDGNVQRLRSTTPIRMRADRIDQSRFCRECDLHVPEATVSDGTQERGNCLVCRQRACGRTGLS
jgi:hypothetical protein